MVRLIFALIASTLGSALSVAACVVKGRNVSAASAVANKAVTQRFIKVSLAAQHALELVEEVGVGFLSRRFFGSLGGGRRGRRGCRCGLDHGRSRLRLLGGVRIDGARAGRSGQALFDLVDEGVEVRGGLADGGLLLGGGHRAGLGSRSGCRWRSLGGGRRSFRGRSRSGGSGGSRGRDLGRLAA